MWGAAEPVDEGTSAPYPAVGRVAEGALPAWIRDLVRGDAPR